MEKDDIPVFDKNLTKSVFIESLKMALDELLAGAFIRKDAADSILYEACAQYRTFLMKSEISYPNHYMAGHLQHYKQTSEQWTLVVKNPVISLSCKGLAIDGPHGGRRGTGALCKTIGKSFFIDIPPATFPIEGLVKLIAVI